VYYVIPWFDGFKGLVVCAVSGGERVRYVQRGSPRFGLGYLRSPCAFVIRSISCRMCMVSLDSVWAWVSVCTVVCGGTHYYTVSI